MHMQGICKAPHDVDHGQQGKPVYLHPLEAVRPNSKGDEHQTQRNAEESRCLYDERNLFNIPLCPFFSVATSSLDAQHPLTPIVNHEFFLR